MSYRFSYIQYDEETKAKGIELKAKFEELETLMDKLLEDGRAKALCLTNLEQSYAWLGKSLRDSQVKRTKQFEDKPERGNE